VNLTARCSAADQLLAGFPAGELGAQLVWFKARGHPWAADYFFAGNLGPEGLVALAQRRLIAIAC